MNRIITAIFALIALISLSACSPEPGTKAWCEKMKETPKGEWSANDAGTFTKYCVLGNYKEK
ncbi:Protein of unknown function (DUF3012) [Mariprofundus ferrinatatus]|uniref:DUF3012 domain-containing protein n=1 Tax=Mariprofundus ferrinatatus TaxID=1921087 RepID=A0A2K8L7T4_9PROT|nr:DUF3012 domain-containing protein [Mariprofundus ferrinatatus]ATX82309.1 Protein of unknown function (DUF3012) [Mariprofundus ferrinatatus]